ncbi:MAG: MBL fold metallo-hydrolase [Bacteroidia bacterium]
MKVQYLTFGPFQENTYVLSDETNECVIIDPGCYGSGEQQDLKRLIEDNGLKPVHLLNTHCHVDHVAGNLFVYETYGLKPQIHKNDLPVLNSQQRVSEMYGLPCELSPLPEAFFDEGDKISFGNTELEVIFTPGHAPGHVVFYHKAQGILINGDVLFRGSIGRTDLPLGDHDTLIRSIKTKLFVLPDDTVVYTGHGPETTIGMEKKSNPFLQ